MIILSATNQKIVVNLGQSAATQLDWTASYIDVTATTYVPGSSVGTTNSTTDVDVVTAPAASTQRHVKLITVYNANSSANVVMIKKVNGASTRVLCKILLQPNDTLQYCDAEGFSVIRNSGTSVTDGATLGLSAGTQSAYGPNTFILSNTNGLSFGLNTNSVLTASASGVSVSYWDAPHGAGTFGAIGSSNSGSGNLILQRYWIPFYMTVTRADIIAHISHSALASGTMTNFIGIYSRSLGNLNLGSSTSSTLAFAAGGTSSDTNSYSGISGTRIRSFAPQSWAITPGEWWLAYGLVASTTQTAFTMSFLCATSGIAPNAFPSAASGNSLGNENNYMGIAGLVFSGNTDIPQRIGENQMIYGAINGQATAFRMPYMRFYGTY
jgi:hypothetical protein